LLMEANLLECYPPYAINAACIETKLVKFKSDLITHNSNQLNRRIYNIVSPKTVSAVSNDVCFFHVIINGWNCGYNIHKCLGSIINQLPGKYNFKISIVDDASTDNTCDVISDMSVFPYANIIRVDTNTGAAFARHSAISLDSNPETIVVLLDMDDALLDSALKTVANVYLKNPKCLMTFGNWVDTNGVVNPLHFYDSFEIDKSSTRLSKDFRAPHLRTFKRKLYYSLQEADLCDDKLNWFETCTDVALLHVLLDQCYSEEIEYISKPIYLYDRGKNNITRSLDRFGKIHKNNLRSSIQARVPNKKISDWNVH